MSIADFISCLHCLFHNVSMFRLYLNRHDLAAPVVPVVAQHDVAPIVVPVVAPQDVAQPGREDGAPVAQVVPVVAPQDVAPQPGQHDGASVEPLEKIGVIGAGLAEKISQEIGGRVENDAPPLAPVAVPVVAPQDVAPQPGPQDGAPVEPLEEIGVIGAGPLEPLEEIGVIGAGTAGPPELLEPPSEPAEKISLGDWWSTGRVEGQPEAEGQLEAAKPVPSEAEGQLAKVMSGDCEIEEFLFGPEVRSCKGNNLMQFPPSSADVVEAVVEAVAEGAAKEDEPQQQKDELLSKQQSSDNAEEDEQPLSKLQKITNDAEEAEPLSKQQEDEPMPKRQKKQAAEEGDEPLVKLTAGQLKSMKMSELYVTAAKLQVKRPKDKKKNDLITLILEKMEALPDPPDTDKYGHVLSLLTKGAAKSLSDLAKSG